MDRRTLAKRLERLPPAQTKKVGGHTDKKWRLQDVLRLLKLGDGEPMEEPPSCLRIFVEVAVQHFVCWLTEQWWGAGTGMMEMEFG
jgi:hypothetical protein